DQSQESKSQDDHRHFDQSRESIVRVPAQEVEV
ncbi:MAG: hypothetical protein ACI809_001635, partial [Candidatus Azotimanducaceae bacterium]